MVYFIPTPIGNLDDISVRALKCLAECRTLFCEDTRNTKKLLSLLSQRHGLRVNVERYISLHSHNENTLLEKIDATIFDQTVGYLSDAGMPGISDPGAGLIRYCQRSAIAYEVLPGANAALLAYVSSGVKEHRFCFFGFLPHKGAERKEALLQALNTPLPIILYESPHRIEKLLEELCLYAPERPMWAIKEATKLHERHFAGTPLAIQAAFKEANLKGEWVVVLDALPCEHQGTPITKEELLELPLPPKLKAKLLSKVTGLSIKECYSTLQTEH